MSLNTIERAHAQERFLTCYAESGQVLKAARWAKMPSSVHYKWLDEDPTYRIRYQAIAIKAAQRLEDEAVQAECRVRTLVRDECQAVRADSQFEQEYSGRLLEKLLEAADHERFKRLRVIAPPGELDNMTESQGKDLVAWLRAKIELVDKMHLQEPKPRAETTIAATPVRDPAKQAVAKLGFISPYRGDGWPYKVEKRRKL